MAVRMTAAGWLLVVMASVGCGSAPSSGQAVLPEGDAAPVAAPAPSDTPSAPVAAERRIVFLGDSLTAGLGLPAAQSYPSLLQARLDTRNAGWQVVNAGVSGDTSAGGLRRLDWALDGGAAIVVIALGANDGLRGLPVERMADNLERAVVQAQGAGARVVLAGMEAPPNYGSEYTTSYRAVYPAIAARHDAVLIPFLLDGVAGVESLNQADGIHPNQAGARLVADIVWRALEPIVRELETRPTR